MKKQTSFVFLEREEGWGFTYGIALGKRKRSWYNVLMNKKVPTQNLLFLKNKTCKNHQRSQSDQGGRF